jgi:hypothetical protein
MRQNFVAIFKLDPKGRAGKRFFHNAVEFYDFLFFGHTQ